MIENELIWDGRLQIKTAGRDDINSDEYRYPYEPTPYCVLQRLADSGLIGEGDTVLDYSSGKEKQKMEQKKTLEEVRRLFAGDRFATENGAVIDEIGHRSAVCSLHITDSHRNAMGAVMGGVYFMLADFAFAVAANWESMGCVSLHADISFLGAAKGETLTAKAVCVKDGKTTACYRVDMTDSLGNLAATVTVTGYHVG